MTLLVTVRHVQSWLVSMSRKYYELFPGDGPKRTAGDMRWLLGEVELRQDANWVRHPFGELRFETAIDLWITYVQGYLAGRIAPAGDASRVLLVRREDLLRSPDLVVHQ